MEIQAGLPPGSRDQRIVLPGGHNRRRPKITGMTFYIHGNVMGTNVREVAVRRRLSQHSLAKSRLPKTEVQERARNPGWNSRVLERKSRLDFRAEIQPGTPAWKSRDPACSRCRGPESTGAWFISKGRDTLLVGNTPSRE